MALIKMGLLLSKHVAKKDNKLARRFHLRGLCQSQNVLTDKTLRLKRLTNLCFFATCSLSNKPISYGRVS